MRMIMAVDEVSKVSFTSNMPACIKWAMNHSEKTGNPVKLLVGRPGCKDARIFAEATPDGLRAVHAGRVWKWRRLERTHGKQAEKTS